ncbi:restriction endonuclease subunit S [[Pseudomonas] boreopolis]|uniref:restriction endonuclease subunit S n=1 Tax=Xanthomonas boreopolis TaxID=86183 RepID=UPI003D3A707A
MNGTETGSATLAELCDLISEQVHPADVPEALYVGLEHVTPGRLRRSGGGIAADVQSHKYAFRRNDILYGKLRPYLDKAILADTDGVCTTELLVLRAKPGVDPRFLACLVHDPDFVEHALTGVTGAHHPRTSWAHIAQFECPRFSYEEQQAIAALLWRVQDLLKVCEDTLEVAQDLKRAAMRELFTRGLRGEPQKETEIGPVPESWQVTSLEAVAIVRGGTSFPPALQGKHQGAFPFCKVSDMNLPGNELEMRSAANWIDRADLEQLRAKPFPRETIIFPKVGGALHTNKKRLLIRDALVDNNIMGVTIIENVPCRPKYLFAWFQTINLSSIANAGPLPSINSSQLYELKLPLPDLAEQDDIIAILDAIDRKIELHRKKRAVLEELFKALLHKLMTGEIRVDELDLSALQAPAEPLSPAAEPAV